MGIFSLVLTELLGRAVGELLFLLEVLRLLRGEGVLEGGWLVLVERILLLH